jgi:hypothetical protein
VEKEAKQAVQMHPHLMGSGWGSRSFVSQRRLRKDERSAGGEDTREGERGRADVVKMVKSGENGQDGKRPRDGVYMNMNVCECECECGRENVPWLYR